GCFWGRPEGHWEDGTNVLWIPHHDAEAGPIAGSERLFDVRERRVHPGTADKILAAWNGLALAAFAEAGRAFGEHRYVDAACDVLRFLRSNLVHEGRVRRSWREGRTSGLGYLDDYALVGLGALSLYETTFDGSAFAFARSLAANMLKLFRAPAGGGCCHT